MPETIFGKASTFFSSLEKKPRAKLYNDLVSHRRKIVERMLEEELQENLFGALTMFIALHFFGFGILHSDISTLLQSYEKDVYPFHKLDIEKAFQNDLSEILLHNWQPTQTGIGAFCQPEIISVPDLFRKRINALWKGDKRTLDCYEAAGGSKGTSFLHEGWPTKDTCDLDRAEAMITALVPAEVRANSLSMKGPSALKFVKNNLTRDSKPMVNFNKKLKKYMDNPEHTEFPSLCDVKIKAKDLTKVSSRKVASRSNDKASLHPVDSSVTQDSVGRPESSVTSVASLTDRIFRWEDCAGKVVNVEWFPKTYYLEKYDNDKKGLQTIQSRIPLAGKDYLPLFYIRRPRGHSTVYENTKNKDLFCCATSQAPESKSKLEVAERVWCKCQRGRYGKMIKCDNQNDKLL